MAKYLLAAENINWMAVFALLTFVFIFVLSVIMAFGKKKDSYQRIAQLPLDDTTTLPTE
ncbi:MAG: hypothetical protein AAFU03_02450 [Bacteroidota bacterium]